ncbi:hypothetical protein C2S52_014920 [Perilla frutescens var. hirtella]|nr:hypothetical protein C2S52_014920 [Perilla frutescens var. hirtella]
MEPGDVSNGKKKLMNHSISATMEADEIGVEEEEESKMIDEEPYGDLPVLSC